MKTIIAGSRSITNNNTLLGALELVPWSITEVVCGNARGVDTLGRNWAYDNKIPIKYFPAMWNKYGKAAGPIRNKQMAEYADSLLLVWDGVSRGSKNMYETWTSLKGTNNVINVIIRS